MTTLHASRTKPVTCEHRKRGLCKDCKAVLTTPAGKAWAPGKASGRCPHCDAGHVERRSSALGDYFVCVGGCGRSGTLG